MYRKRWISETECLIQQFTGSIWRQSSEESAGYLGWLAAGNAPEEISYIPPEPPVPPTLESLKSTKEAEVRAAYEAAQKAGALTTPGLTMRFGDSDCVAVDGVVRYAELKGLPIVPLLVEADGTNRNDVSLADGKTIVLEQFEAAFQADLTLRGLLAAIAAAETPEELELIAW